MSFKFHFNPVTGQTRACTASRGSCPFGELHYETDKEARVAFEATQKEELFTTLKKPKMSKVYRAGDLTAPDSYFDDLSEIIDAMDSFAPEGRTPRRGAIFASPDLRSHTRWIRGLGNEGKQSHELSVNPDEVYVYPVDSYEVASIHQGMGKDFSAAAKEYWDAGMTLTEWRVWAEKNNPPAGSWEILLPPDAIASSRNVSDKRILEHAEDDFVREQLQWQFRRNRRR